MVCIRIHERNVMPAMNSALQSSEPIQESSSFQRIPINVRRIELNIVRRFSVIVYLPFFRIYSSERAFIRIHFSYSNFSQRPFFPNDQFSELLNTLSRVTRRSRLTDMRLGRRVKANNQGRDGLTSGAEFAKL